MRKSLHGGVSGLSKLPIEGGRVRFIFSVWGSVSVPTCCIALRLSVATFIELRRLQLFRAGSWPPRLLPAVITTVDGSCCSGVSRITCRFLWFQDCSLYHCRQAPLLLCYELPQHLTNFEQSNLSVQIVEVLPDCRWKKVATS